MNKLLAWWISPLLLAACLACKRPPTATQPSHQPQAHALALKQINYRYFSSKAKVNYKDADNNMSLIVSLRMRQDSIIWASVSPGLGIEVMRCKLTPDSIFVIDRFNKVNHHYDYGHISDKLNFKVSFAIFQSMIMGNMPNRLSENDNIAQDSAYYIVEQQQKELAYTNYVSKKNLQLEKLLVNQQDTNNTLSLVYNNFSEALGFLFPIQKTMQITYITPEGEANSYIEMSHQKIDFTDFSIDFPFDMPTNYSQKP